MKINPSENGKRLSLEEDIEFIKQLIDVLGEAHPKLKKSYSRRDYGDFAETKIFMKQVQKEINEVLK